MLRLWHTALLFLVVALLFMKNKYVRGMVCILCFAGIPFVAYAIATSFTEHQVGGSSYDQVRAMEAIDLDADGDMDIVSVSDVQNDLTWWENNGSESFTERTIDGSIDGIYDVKVIDIDGDGDLDIAFSAANTPKTGWYENNGSQSFTQRTLNATYQGTCVDAGDVDGDLDIDIVSCKYGTSIIWWENDGSQNFTERTVSTGNTTAIQIRLVDLDDDGDMDVVSTWQTGNKILWYDNNGSETFTQRTIDNTATTPWYMVVGDVDDDGDKDVVAAVYSENAIFWYENNGSETFTEHNVGSVTTPYGVSLADVDGDGDKDIAATGYDAAAVYWFDNDGSESFTRRTAGSSFEQAGRVQIVDVDGDGDNDMVSAGLTNNYDNVTWWENTGPTAPIVSTLSPADGGYNVSTTANLVITFDQTVQGGTGAVVIKKSSDNSVVETLMMTGGLISGSGSTQITINPSSTLATDTDYYINIGKNAFKGARSAHYAGISNATSWNFTTQDTTPPSVSTLSPADNATGINQTANLVITFAESVQGGTGTIVIKKASDNSTVESIAANNVSYVSGSGTTQLTVNPASTPDAYVDYYVTVHANAVKDRAGNYFAGISDAITWNFTTADLTNPTLSSVTPADNSTGVSNTVNLVMNFSEAVQGGTGTIVVKKSSDNSVFETITTNNTTYVTGSGTTQITVNLSGALSLNTSYYVILNKNAFQDAYGRDYAGYTSTTTWNFTTGATDTTKPTVVALSPSDNATGVSSTANLLIVFDEAVQGGTGTVVIKKTSDDSTVESITTNDTGLVSGSGTTWITINPASALSDETQYYVIINKNAFQDSRGNDYQGFTSTTTWNFTTTDSTAPVLSAIAASPSTTGSTITWTTDEVSTSKIQFGPTVEYGSGTTVLDTSPTVTSHSITLGGIRRCALYHYRVISTDPSSNTATGSDLTFTTMGCTGSANVQAQTGALIAHNVRTSFSLGSTGASIIVPVGATTNDAAYQIKQIAKDSVTGIAGVPTGKSIVGSVFNLLALSGTTVAITSFSEAITVTLRYVIGDIAGLDESSLWIYRYDGSDWYALDLCSVDTSAHTVSCTTTNFSDFTLFGSAGSASPSGGDGAGGGGGGSGGGSRRITPGLIRSTAASLFGTVDADKNDVAATIFDDVRFTDWFAPFVLYLEHRGVVSGYADQDGRALRLFRPANLTTYAELAAILLRITHQEPIMDQSYAQWGTPYVEQMRRLQYEVYRAAVPMNDGAPRGAVIHSALETYGIAPIAGLRNIFSDLPDDHPWKDAILTAAQMGIVNGEMIPGGLQKIIRPDTAINRAELAKILYFLSERNPTPSPRQMHAVAPAETARPMLESAVSGVDADTQFSVLTPTLNLRSDSRLDAAVRLVLHKGTKMHVLRTVHDNWVHVRLLNGVEGYVFAKYIDVPR